LTTLDLKGGVATLREEANGVTTNVVSRSLVLGTGISQTDD
jgi:hypothetical protein